MSRHWERIFRVVRGMLGTDEDAEDVTQEAWVKAWKGIGGFRGDCAPAGWLTRIAVRSAIDFMRHVKRTPFGAMSPLEEHEGRLASGAPSPEESLRTVGLAEELERARGALSPRQQAVFEMKAVRGMDFAEISAAVGCGPSAARQHYFRSLRKLRSMLGGAS